MTPIPPIPAIMHRKAQLAVLTRIALRLTYPLEAADIPPMHLNRPVPYLKPGRPLIWVEDFPAPTPRADWPIADPWLEDISIAYLLDLPDQKYSLYVNRTHLTRLRLSVETLRQEALDELWDRVDSELRIHDLENDCFGLTLDGNFEASTLLLPELWAQDLAATLPGGQLVAAIPSRDVVIYGSATCPHSLLHLRTVIDRLWTNPATDHLLTQSLFRWNEKTEAWEIFENGPNAVQRPTSIRPGTRTPNTKCGQH